MRLLHIADLHIGKRVCEFSMLDDQRHILTQVLDLLRGGTVDALLVAGDLYDKPSPSSEAVSMVDWFFDEVAQSGVPAVVIPGNHDSAERVGYAAASLARRGVYVSPVFNGSVDPIELEDEWGPVRIWPIPFLRPATVRHYFPDAMVENYTDAMRVVVEACDLGRIEGTGAVRNVAVAHQFVTAGAFTPERCDSEVSVGGLDNVDAGVFEPFDYVALGHIHGPQRVGSERVRYSGSVLKYSLSEADGQKSAVLVELGAAGDSPTIELVPLRPLHDLRRIRGPLDRLVSPEVVGAADSHDYLHVLLTDENPAIDAMARLRDVYPNVMSVAYDNARTRAEGLAMHDAPATDEASPLELFNEFYERQNGAPLSDGQLAVVTEELERIKVM